MRFFDYIRILLAYHGGLHGCLLELASQLALGVLIYIFCGPVIAVIYLLLPLVVVLLVLIFCRKK